MTDQLLPLAATTLTGDATLELPEFEHPPRDPLALIREWLHTAGERRIREPFAMTLATAAADGHPSSRVVLVKAVDDRGLLFTSHRSSRKGRELLAVPHGAGTFYWRETMQQLNVAGPVEQLSDEQSEALYAGSARARPVDWVGYRLVIDRVEFWHGSPDRLHRRLEYVRTASGWDHARLKP